MKRLLKRCALAAFGLVLSGVCVAQDYKSFPANTVSGQQDGIYYSLPQTELVFDVCVEKVNEYKGCYADYAYLLGLKNIVINDAVSYRIKSIKVRTRAIADAKHTYFLSGAQNDNVLLSDFGTLLAINPKDLAKEKPCCKKAEKPNRKSREPQRVLSDTKPVYERRMLARGMSEALPGMTPDKTVKQIEALRSKQVEILSGDIEGTYMNTTVDFMYRQLDEMIDGYVAMFAGERVSEELHYTFTIVPEKPLIVEQDLLLGIFKFSETEGVKPLSFAGDMPMVVANLHSLNTTKPYSVIEEQREKDEKLQSKIVKKGVGVYYRIPEKVELTVNYGDKVLSKTLDISQFGQTTFMFSSPKSISFSAENGALEYVGK